MKAREREGNRGKIFSLRIMYDRFLNWYRINDILKKYLYSCCCMILSIDLVQREMWTFSIVLPRLLLIIDVAIDDIN